MPFFPNAHNFTVHNGQMNDIAGNYTENKTKTETNNSDSNNTYVGSSVRKGNTETHTATIGNGNDNNITVGHSGAASNATNLPQSAMDLLQLIGGPVITPKRAPLPPDVSKSLGILHEMPGDAWTSDMTKALELCVRFIQTAQAARASK